MYEVGQPEIDAIAEVVRSGRLFRYLPGGRCERFEQRWVDQVGVDHCVLTASGTAALTAALAGAGLGPGDEVVVPAHTYMATALSVLAAGAIPVIVEVDESALLDPAAVEATVTAPGSAVRAVVPVHMWGLPCDMDALGEVARRHDLIMIEDACQAVGGSYRGASLGSIGTAGAFSFNFYKNLTAGEAGAVVTSDAGLFDRARCMIDPCAYYWSDADDPRAGRTQPFAASGSRASELAGAMLGAQLDRLPDLLARLRSAKGRLAHRLADAGFTLNPVHDPEGDCGSNLLVLVDDPATAADLAPRVRGEVLSDTGRHNYTEWDPILARRGAHHPALDPFQHPANQGLRSHYRLDQCARSLDLLARTVKITVNPRWTDDQLDRLCGRLVAAPA